MPHAALALDVLPLDADALLAADPFFVTVCDERADRARAAQDASCCVRCGVDHTDQEHALTPGQADRLGADANTALVCWDCLKAIRAELAARPTLPAPPDAPDADDAPRDGDLIDCRDCQGTGEGWSGQRCGRCAGRGYHVHRDGAATH